MSEVKKMQFFWYNLIEQDSTVITGGDENALFPASNLKDYRSTKVYRSNVASDSITFDFITTQPVDSVLIRAHLFDGLGFNGDLTIKANATDAGWGTPAFETTLTPNSEFGFGQASFVAENYRFWRIEGVGSVYFELADLFIGQAYESPRNISRQFTIDNEDLSSTQTNRYGQRFVDERNDRRVIDGNINLIKKADVGGFYDFIDYAGKKKSFFVILDEGACIIDHSERFSGRFFFRQKPKPQHVINGIYSTSVLLQEAP